MTIRQDALDIRCLSRIGLNLIWPALTESFSNLMMTGCDTQFRLTIYGTSEKSDRISSHPSLRLGTNSHPPPVGFHGLPAHLRQEEDASADLPRGNEKSRFRGNPLWP